MNPDFWLNLEVVITLLCWGAWGIFDKKALEKSAQIEVMILLYIVSIVTVPLCYILLNCTSPGWGLKPEIFIWTGLACLTYTGAMFAYLGAMRRSDASYVLGITASYPVVLQLLATLFLGENLVFNRVLGALVIAAGVTLIGTSGHGSQEKEKDESGEKGKDNSKTLVLVLSAIATFCWGTFGLMDKKALSYGSPLEVFFAQRLWDVLMLLVMLAVTKKMRLKINLGRARTWFFCTLSEGCLAIGALCYLFALSASTASYVVTITGCYPLLMYLLALWFLKEKFSVMRLLGIALTVAGGLVVHLTQHE